MVQGTLNTEERTGGGTLNTETGVGEDIPILTNDNALNPSEEKCDVLPPAPVPCQGQQVL